MLESLRNCGEVILKSTNRNYCEEEVVVEKSELYGYLHDPMMPTWRKAVDAEHKGNETM